MTYTCTIDPTPMTRGVDWSKGRPTTGGLMSTICSGMYTVTGNTSNSVKCEDLINDTPSCTAEKFAKEHAPHVKRSDWSGLVNDRDSTKSAWWRGT